MLGVIPAAGLGTRLRELGRLYPKSILPYKDRPLLVHNVEWLRRQGCEEIVIVVNHQKEKIQEVIDTYDLNVKIADVEIEGGGLSQSVLSGIMAREETEREDESVLILLGDLLVTDGEVDFSTNSVSTFEVEDWSRWCMVDPVTGVFYDKPQEKPPTNLAISGVYYIQSVQELSDLLSSQLSSGEKIRGEFQISTSLARLKDPVKCFHLEILDFGTLADFLRNRGLRNSRSFNSVRIQDDFVVKQSQKRNKIIAEANWYRSVPDEIAIRTPRILQTDLHDWCGSCYTMERVLHPSLRELFLFLDRSTELWTQILTDCFHVHSLMQNYDTTQSSASFLIDKTTQRVKQSGIQNKTVNRFLDEFFPMVHVFEDRSTLIHGDFCFSNLMWNSGSKRIVMLDPRGELYGSPYYDVAKLRHSILYGYDFIDAHLWSVSEQGTRIFDDGVEHLRDLYKEMESERFTSEEIRYLDLLTASLFLTMIPLHYHSSQNQKLFYEKFNHIWSQCEN